MEAIAALPALFSSSAAAGYAGAATTGGINLGTILGGAGILTTAIGGIRQANDAEAASKFKADQLEERAFTSEASAISAANEQRRRHRIMASRALAVSAASGGGTLNPNVVSTISDFAEFGEEEARSALYQGYSSARSDRLAANAAELEGSQAKSASLLGTAGTILSSGASLYDKYKGYGSLKNFS